MNYFYQKSHHLRYAKEHTIIVAPYVTNKWYGILRVLSNLVAKNVGKKLLEERM
jgi:hypothetical protein